MGGRLDHTAHLARSAYTDLRLKLRSDRLGSPLSPMLNDDGALMHGRTEFSTRHAMFGRLYGDPL